MDRKEKEKQAKINTKDEKIWVTQLMQRYGKQELTTMLVKNPNWSGRKQKKRNREP